MNYVNFITNLLDLPMTHQQRKVALYLGEYLKFNDKPELPSNSQISKATKVSVNSISQIIKDLKLQLLKNDGIVWYMLMPDKENNLVRLSEELYKEGTFTYIPVKFDTFQSINGSLLETYVRIVRLNNYIKTNKNYTPSWKVLSTKWNINYETLRKQVYKLYSMKLINYDLKNNSYVSKLEVV